MELSSSKRLTYIVHFYRTTLDFFIMKLNMLKVIFFQLNIFVCFGCRVEETRLITKGDSITFPFPLIVELSNAFVFFGKDSKDILRYEIGYVSGNALPYTTYYSRDHKERIFVNRLDSENTTITLINANISDSGTYNITNEWNDVERCWTVFVIGIEEDRGQMIVNEGTTVSFLAYPLLSTISSHPRWNISCLWLFDGKRKFKVSDPVYYFHVHGDRMWIPRLTRDLDKKVVTYRCRTFDDTTVDVKRILSVSYTKWNGSDCPTVTVAGTSGKVLTGNDVIKGDSASSMQTIIIVGISLVLSIMISFSVAVAVRHTCKLRERRRRQQAVAKSIEEEGPNFVSGRVHQRSQFYIHARRSESLYDLPDELTMSNNYTSDFLQMDPMEKPRDSYVSMK